MLELALETKKISFNFDKNKVLAIFRELYTLFDFWIKKENYLKTPSGLDVVRQGISVISIT